MFGCPDFGISLEAGMRISSFAKDKTCSQNSLNNPKPS
jgi:hypothetical protein